MPPVICHYVLNLDVEVILNCEVLVVGRHIAVIDVLLYEDGVARVVEEFELPEHSVIALAYLDIDLWKLLAAEY